MAQYSISHMKWFYFRLICWNCCFLSTLCKSEEIINWRQLRWIGWFTCVIVNCTMRQQEGQEEEDGEEKRIDMRKMNSIRKTHNHNNKPTNEQKSNGTSKMSPRMRFYRLNDAIVDRNVNGSIFGVNGCITVIHCPLHPYDRSIPKTVRSTSHAQV